MERKITRADMRRGLLAYGMTPDDIRDWEEYHAKNPNVWWQLELLFLCRVQAGAQRIGIKKLFEDLRDHPEIQKSFGEEWRLNNNHTSHYGRALAVKYPQFASLIEFRSLKRAA